MTWEIVVGLTCGLASAAVSESVLRLGAPTLKRSLFKALAVGTGLRTLWILALTGWVLGSSAADPRWFVPALMAGYFAAQVFEGVRYTRYFEQC